MIWIYEQGFEDFSTNGLGQLHPVRCHLSEEQAGAYELELEHPISDDLLSWELIKTGRVIKVPVPAQTTPLIHMEGAAGYEVWKTNRATKVYTKKTTSMGTRVTQESPDPYHEALLRPDVVKVKDATSVTVWKSNGNRVLESLENNAQVTVLKKDGAWYRITTAKGATGWVQAAHVTLVQTVPDTPPETIQERKTRDQLFRIYRAEKDTAAGVVKAWARHISYDLLANVLISCKVEDVTVSAAIAAINTACTQTDHGFTVYTNSTAKVTADWSRKGYLEALLDPEEGLAALANLRVVRDNYDIFLLERSTTRRQAITHGRNLLGVSVDISEDGVVNRIIPVGKTKDGKVLHIDATYVDSPRNGEGTIIRAKVIEYEVAEKEARDGQPAVTLAQAKAKLVQLANADFEAGIDLPDISVKVDFLLLGDTEEYKAYRDLDRLYLGDIVTVISDVHQVSLEAEVTRVEYSPLSGTYLGMEVGVTDAARTIGSTASFMLPNGSLGGRKIAMGSLDGGHLQGASISGSHIKDSAITNSHFMNGTISGSIFEDGTITGSKIDASTFENGSISGTAIDASTFTNGSISGTAIDASTFTNGQISGSKIDSSTLTNIPYAQIKDLDVTGDAIFRQSVLGDGTFYLDKLIVNSANIGTATIGELMVRDAQGKLHKVLIGTNGVVSSEEVKVDGQNLSNDAMMQVSQRLVWRQATQPSAPFIGMIWMDTSLTPAGKPKEILKRCTAITPTVTWEVVQSNELHTNVIDVDDNGMNILSGGNLNLLSGGAINIKNLSGTDNVINMDSTGLTLSSTGQLKLQSTDSIIIGGSPFSVGGVNLIPHSDTSADILSYWTKWESTPNLVKWNSYIEFQEIAGGPSGILSPPFRLSARSGDSLTLSFKAAHRDAAAVLDYCYIIDPVNGNKNLSVLGASSVTTAGTTNHPRYTMTFTLDASYDHNIQILIGTNDRNAGHRIVIGWPQLEKGTMATDWSPHPSDPASGVKTSSVEVNSNGIYMDTTGTFNVNAGVGVNIKGGSGASSIGISNNDANNYFLWAGHGTPASAPFSVKRDGSVKATKIQHEMPYTFWDMADGSTPAEFPVYIPSGYTIDSVTFTFQTKKARTFAKSAASGGSSSVTSAANNVDNTGSASGNTGSPSTEYTGYGGTGNTGAGSAHTHTITNHRHSYTMGASNTGYTQPGATNEGSHTHSGPNHRHSLNGHVHDLGSHTHSLNNHTHGVTVPAHTHGINYGINEKSTLATSCELKVGATTIGTYSPDPSAPVEIKSSMAAGWNTITVQPNDDARIVAFALVKLTPA